MRMTTELPNFKILFCATTARAPSWTKWLLKLMVLLLLVVVWEGEAAVAMAGVFIIGVVGILLS